MQQLTFPGIEFAPAQVRRHGLREFHTYPLVSHGKDAAGVWRASFRVPAAQAWDYPELELGRTGNSIPALLFDMDGDPTDWLVDVLGPALPRPNWIVWRRDNMHGHLIYTLARPVVTGAEAKRTPQAYLARITEYLHAQLHADAAYSSVLGHNPLSQASHGRYTTDWMREEPYRLEELAECMPKGWRRPTIQPQTSHGRNDALFKAGMKWSGEPGNWGNWEGLAAWLWETNQGFIQPLGLARGRRHYQVCAGLPGAQPRQRPAAADVLIYPGGPRQEVRTGAADADSGPRRGHYSGCAAWRVYAGRGACLQYHRRHRSLSAQKTGA